MSDKEIPITLKECEDASCKKCNNRIGFYCELRRKLVDIERNKFIEKIPSEIREKYQMEFKYISVTFLLGNNMIEIPLIEIVNITIDIFGKVIIKSVENNAEEGITYLTLWAGKPCIKIVYFQGADKNV